MITISGSIFINGLREIASSLKTQIKNVSSVLAHIGSVTNTGTDYYPSPRSFYKRKPSPAPTQNIPFTDIKHAHTAKPLATVPLAAKIDPIIAHLQLRPENHPTKIAHGIASVKTRRAPLPPSLGTTRPRPVNAVTGQVSRKSRRAPLPPPSPTLIAKLEQTIEKDKKAAAWDTRFTSPGNSLKPTRRAPLRPLSEPMVEKLVQMIESDRQSPERALMADVKLAIKDVQFNTQMRKKK